MQGQQTQNMTGQQSSVPSSKSGGCCFQQGGCLSQNPGGCCSRGYVTQAGINFSGQGQGPVRTAYDLSQGVQRRSQGNPVFTQGNGGDPVITTLELLRQISAREMRSVLQEVSQRLNGNEQKRVCTWKVGRNSARSEGSKFYPT